ncbi:MAG: type II secretion system minor pseudopilin [Planctomycetota bacterium]
MSVQRQRRGSLRDEQGYLNINKSDPASWENIEDISRACRASILDWIDEDDDVSADGAESDFYGRLEPPYVSKNKPYIALRELLFLKAVTRSTYMGEDLNRNSLLDDNERDALVSLPADNGDNRLDPGLVDLFTVYGDGRINVNTVSRTILSALPGFDEYAAETVLAYRAGSDGRLGTDDDVSFENREGFAAVEGLTELQVELLKEYCRFDSECFRIFSHASVHNAFECSVMATVKWTQDGPQVVCLERLL